MTPKPPVSLPPDRPGEWTVVRFGVFEVDLRNGELRKGGVLIKLQQQPFKVLALLVGRPGDIVTREELRCQIWGGDTFVDFDQGLNFCIKQIRAALGDQADTPRYVETLPRRGYRFIAPLERRELTPPPEAAPASHGDESPATPPRPLPFPAFSHRNVCCTYCNAVLPFTEEQRSGLRAGCGGRAWSGAPLERTF